MKSTTSGPVSLIGGEIIASNQISVVYSASANTFTILNPPIQSASGSTAPLCGANNLNITNNVGTPNSIITITADTAVMVSSGGLIQNRGSVSQTINISTGTATTTVGGMDGEAPGTSAWLYVWLIDNGAANGALASVASGSGLSPTLPSGYVYKCRVGAMRVYSDGTLMRTLQRGAYGQYTVVTPSNTPSLPINDSGAKGTFSAISPVLASVTVTGDSSFVPITAKAIKIVASAGWKENSVAGGSSILVAPNCSYSGSNNGPVGLDGQTYPIYLNNSNYAINAIAEFVLEGSTVCWASSGATAALSTLGWTDQVNAN